MSETASVKHCVKCGCADFYKGGHCKQCRNLYTKNYREENKDKVNKRRREIYKSTAKKKDQKLIEERKAARRERQKKLYASWLERNKDRKKETDKVWRQNNPHAVKARDATRDARRRNAKGKITKSVVDFLLSAQNGKCVCCRSKLPKNFHIDHIEPLSKGGSNEKDNLQLLCPSCNLKKSSKNPIDFMQQLGFLL